MTAKEYLQQIHKCDANIDNKLHEVESLREMALSITSTWKEEVVQSSGTQDKLCNTVTKIVDLQEEINKDIDRLVDLKREIIRTIDKINDSQLQTILYKRYLQYEKWEVIAIDMGYSYRQITRMHGKALQKLKDVL